MRYSKKSHRHISLSNSDGEYVKTNWQQLIFEYNYNTAGWDIDEPSGWGNIEVLPFDLPIPDYMKLLEDK